ncbi:hypothetical protein B0H13DRAFT_1912696 [Mycena leptocephala]|nr:hypothetical protein B0H13DRAFT_1912696 [Mycena leptocephala]
MVPTKFFSTLASTTVLIGVANAFNGTANLGFFGTTNCGCAFSGDQFWIAVPPALVGSAKCCTDQVILHYEDKTVTAMFTGIYNAGAGTTNVAFSPGAFAVLEGGPSETSLSPVTWSFE